MAELKTLFATHVYEESLAADRGFAALNADLADACRMLAVEDGAGRAWCREHAYGGYTSYASLPDVTRMATAFGDLKKKLDRNAAAFAEALAFDLGPRGRLVLDSFWVNVLKPGGTHSGHIHPHSVLSGTYYVEVPPGAGDLRLEDPRLGLMMAAPPRRSEAGSNASFATLKPAAGSLFLWESWLRHEVLPHRGKGERISLSFNYSWT